ncbi:MAG TPA: Gfo/Idh/MocA family oxidoreductase [Actinomadura sp.]|nr:Gfo/Idh/MocA family oxidoreductase [Actinomadura sp.]
MSRARIAVAGAGAIGKRHIEEIDSSDQAELASIVDPGPAGPELAEKYGAALFPSLAELFAKDKPDGIVLATPNRMHVEGGLECVAAGVPMIVEKPIGDGVEAATQLVEAAEAAGVPLLTGHHRNYSPIMTKAREIIRSGRLGSIVGVVGTALFYKPDDYFDENGGWRREPGGGPILLNLTHEVNNLLSLLGPVDTVQALTSNATRRFPVEDTAAMIFRFTSGALGTFLLSDTAGSARSWEQTSRENISYATYPDEDAYHVTGTTGSLSVPTMRVKVFAGERSWWEPFETSTESVDRSDPLANQITHFVDVIQNGAEPICSGRDGLTTLQVVDAVVEAARTGRPVRVAGGSPA